MPCTVCIVPRAVLLRDCSIASLAAPASRQTWTVCYLLYSTIASRGNRALKSIVFWGPPCILDWNVFIQYTTAFTFNICLWSALVLSLLLIMAYPADLGTQWHLWLWLTILTCSAEQQHKVIYKPACIFEHCSTGIPSASAVCSFCCWHVSKLPCV